MRLGRIFCLRLWGSALGFRFRVLWACRPRGPRGPRGPRAWSEALSQVRRQTLPACSAAEEACHAEHCVERRCGEAMRSLQTCVVKASWTQNFSLVLPQCSHGIQPSPYHAHSVSEVYTSASSQQQFFAFQPSLWSLPSLLGRIAGWV